MAIFVSYSSSDGGPAASAVVEALRARGFDVLWDGDLTIIHPLSIPAWMESAVRDRTVLVIVSDDYLKALLSNDFVERRGVRYEAGLVRHKIYHHGGAHGCAVLPVVPPEVDANALPSVLQQLVIHRFDPSTRNGEEDLVRSLGVLEVGNGGGAMYPESEGVHRTRMMLAGLEACPPSSAQAYQLAHDLVEHGEGDLELARAFDSVVGVAKAHGDVRLVSRLSEVCLKTLSSTLPLKGEGALKAKVLVSGQAWHLLREHRFSQAASVAEEGTQIAKKYRDLYTAARGQRAHARVFLHMATEALPYDREFYLRNCEHLLILATTLFRSISGPTSEEVGVCASLNAEKQLLRYEMTGERAELTAAWERSQVAEGLLTPGTEPYQWLTVLQARLSLAARKYNEGKEFVTDVIATADFPEVVARSRQVRADLLLATREKAEALRDLLDAEEQFRELGCDYAAATCWWTIAKIDSTKLVSFRLSTADVLRLEDLAPDPRDRRLAVLEHEHRSAKRLGRRSAPDWACLVDRVQHE
ncbi:toll/interleukin-1 receptor domain-containing protein [Lentzea sp. BCCO 10_0856]|uniref:Toll/interleukin-1 receptor domain-containing protein n=1 Tax=Lentzea miocenica TaxID=3095431 RepID=A0ABU4TBP0_9PSEU|nr:toll/interleukin-1 receptor domain-containing protein [Lentzea sp. BCCO 10_0856]MDX8035594.1 toll/interleukin-1 receptor domain-containing protein [Lentzea sp. BCCO 10_0856]